VIRLFGALAVAMGTLAAVPAEAQSFEGCTKTERGIIIATMDRSKRLALTAASAVGPTPVYTRWFGKFSPRNGERVRRNLKSVVTAIRTGQVTTACVNHGTGLCDRDTYAFVDPDDHYNVMLCPSFFTMETMKELDDASAAEGNGTRAGTIIHEITHFTIVAGTDDICYSREVCTDMAIDAPQDALINADSYQYFVEDVTYYGVKGE
jgi:peptidyl-Lys metalloendopeptidase